MSKKTAAPMAADTTADAATDAHKQAAAPAAFVAADPARLVLGDLIHVTVQPGVVLRNTETGLPFVPGEAAPQRVTPTTIRRLRDGDLQQVAAPANDM